MTIFNLPDLGEGLPEAEIHEWFVKVGDTVTADEPMVSMETAKAVVDVPAPQSGIIKSLYGKTGDIIKTGAPLIEFESNDDKKSDKGTVVGNLEELEGEFEDNFIIGSANAIRTRTTPAVRLLAKKNHIDLNTLSGTGENGFITKSDVEKEISRLNTPPQDYEVIKGVRKAMLSSMSESHKVVVPVSIFDEANISNWPSGSDITVRLIRAIETACTIEPALNAWFDTKFSARKCFDTLNLGIAMDSDDGLFVPVINDIKKQSDANLRQIINQYKSEVAKRSIKPENLKGATFTLSNFGKFSGRFASPIIVPPMVGILAVGKLYKKPVVVNDEIKIQSVLPLSLSFDHRAVTGGEATRFLGSIMESLSL